MDMDTSLLFDSLLGSGMEDSLALDPAFCALLHLDWQEDGLDSTMLPSWSLPSLPSLPLQPATAASMTHSSSNSAASTHQTQPSSSPVLLAPTTCRGPSKRNRDLNRRGAAKNLDTAGASIPSPFARTVTTLPAETPASKPPVAPSHSGNRCARKSVQPSTPSHVEPSTEDTDDSNDDSNDGEDGPTLAAGSRKRSKVAPEIDWRSITDPAERRRQRRLAKNRLTAARSRERKKSQWAELEGRFNAMESDNRELRDMLKSLGAENKQLRAQLDAALAGDSGSKAAAASAGSHRRAGSNVSLGSGKQSKPSPAACNAFPGARRARPGWHGHQPPGDDCATAPGSMPADEYQQALAELERRARGEKTSAEFSGAAGTHASDCQAGGLVTQQQRELADAIRRAGPIFDLPPLSLSQRDAVCVDGL